MKRASLATLVLAALAPAQSAPGPMAAPRGLILHEDGAFDGYTLLSTAGSSRVFLLDMEGEIVHRWETECETAGGIYLQGDGSLLRLGLAGENRVFKGPGVGGGLLQVIDWDGEVVWQYTISDDLRLMHHDVELLPNGNVLVIVWERVERDEVIGLGRDPDHVPEGGLWIDTILEIERTGAEGGNVVWGWRAKDHLVQDLDPSLPNHGSIIDHPGRIDINADHRDRAPLTLEEQEEQAELEEKMLALGYGGGEDEEEEDDARPGHAPDWLHTNAVDYLEGHDLIVLSTPHMNELWVLDHSTTIEEAAGSSGGRWGHGGEILWRWGNPRIYGAGGDEDRTLFYQHDPTWIAGERPGELRLLVFNNGGERPGGAHSSVDEIVLPFDPEKGFVREEGRPFGPDAPAWSYSDPGRFFSPFISGAQRLPNGNTLACAGVPGRVFEVTPGGDIVWELLNPHVRERSDVPYAPPPTALFRVTRIPKGHPGLAGRELTASRTAPR